MTSLDITHFATRGERGAVLLARWAAVLGCLAAWSLVAALFI